MCIGYTDTNVLEM